MGGLALVAGAAVIGGRTDGPSSAILETSPSPVRTGAGPSRAPARVPAGPSVIRLEHPAREGLIIRPTDMLVAGRLDPRATGVRVLVETARNKPIAVRTAEAAPPASDPGGRPERFAVVIPLADPREGERLIIHVVAYDADGLPVEALRRRVVVGPQEPGVFGEDGLMGGLPFPSDRP